MRAARGFTLLELLIAIAIFALLGQGTYRMLSMRAANQQGHSCPCPCS
ncbi:prepilin-type N-terminal cleavage/methylation domain-containing protein [Pseudomonas anguilliseptica]